MSAYCLHDRRIVCTSPEFGHTAFPWNFRDIAPTQCLFLRLLPSRLHGLDFIEWYFFPKKGSKVVWSLSSFIFEGVYLLSSYLSNSMTTAYILLGPFCTHFGRRPSAFWHSVCLGESLKLAYFAPIVPNKRVAFLLECLRNYLGGNMTHPGMPEG